MTHRERLLTAFRRKQPDRLPWMLNMTPPVQELFTKKTGAKYHNEYWDYDSAWIPPAPSRRPPVDYSRYWNGRKFAGPVSFDPEWGYAMVQRDPNSHLRHWESPFDGKDFTADDARNYPLPDYKDPDRFADIGRQNEDWHKRGYATMYNASFSTFDYSWLIRGYESFLLDMVSGEESATILMDRVSDTIANMLRGLAGAGLDIVGVGEDVGTQSNLIMSPATWRQEIKPRFRKIVAAAKSAKPDVLFFYHSDGNIKEIIPDLIEIGVDVLNPIQPECMDPVEIKRLYGDKLAFWGCVGTQTVMPFGTPAEVRETVHHLFKTVGKGGGFLCGPSHTIEPEVPWENIMAFVNACKECVY